MGRVGDSIKWGGLGSNQVGGGLGLNQVGRVRIQSTGEGWDPI